MNSKLDCIKIENIAVYAYHGVFDSEAKKGQNFYLDATLYVNLRKAGISDELSHTIHYGEVVHYMVQIMKDRRFNLIEAAAECVAMETLIQFSQIQTLFLTIKKPDAPIDLPFENVSVSIERSWHEVHVAYGSNMGEKKETIQEALQLLMKNKMNRDFLKSSDYITKPYGGVEQDDFVNGVVRFKTLYTPEELLDEIHRIEHALKRERVIRWGPRTIDLDILLYDDICMDGTKLTIPHIDMHNRLFVLNPLCEINPYVRHPLFHKTMAQLREELQQKNG